MCHCLGGDKQLQIVPSCLPTRGEFLARLVLTRAFSKEEHSREMDWFSQLQNGLGSNSTSKCEV